MITFLIIGLALGCLMIFAGAIDDASGLVLIGILLALASSGGLLAVQYSRERNEAPAYSSEWIDEETKCHWYGGKLINCETVKCMEEL